ncbi:MAG: PAS domain S-box protein [Candidatus Woesearchaeota archaeon]
MKSEQELNEIFDLILKLSSGNLNARGKLSGKGEAFDAVITGLNLLGEELQARQDEQKKSEELLEKTFQSLNDALFILDNQKPPVILKHNLAAQSIFGYKTQEILGKTTTFLYANDQQLSEFQKSLYPAIEKYGFLSAFEFQMKKRDGTIFPSEHFVTPLKNKLGERVGWVSVVKDLTERKEIERELRKIGTAIDSSINAIALADLDGNLIYVNKSFLKMWGYDHQKEVLGKSAVSFWQCAKSAQGVADRSLGEGGWIGELNAKRKDGLTFIAQLSANLVSDEKGKPLCKMASFIDITEHKQAEQALKESEEKYRSLFEASADGIIIADIKTKEFKYVNPAICKMLGYTADELKKLSVNDIHPTEELKQVISEFEAQARGEKTLAQDIICLRKDGTTLSADINTSKFVMGGNEYNLGIFRDITEKKKAEQEKQKLQEQLRRYAQKLEHKVQKLEKQKIPLNYKEKLVLTALTCYPNSTDKQLAELTHLKRPTITTIRNRLKKEGWYKKINLPDLGRLGYEVLSLLYGPVPQSPDKEKVAEVITHIKETPNCLFFQFSDSFAFVLSAYRTAAEARLNLQKLTAGPGFNDLSGAVKQAHFIISLDPAIKFFDYSTLLKELFSIKLPSPKEEVKLPPMKLTGNEQELIYAFSRFPEANNTEIQKITRLSKPTIIKTRKKLLYRGYLNSIVLPNTQKLGFVFSSLAHYSSDKLIFNDSPLIQGVKENKDSFLSLIGDGHSFIISTFRNYEELEVTNLKKKELYQKTFNTLESPEIFTFQAPKTFKLDFSALVKEKFNLAVNY